MTKNAAGDINNVQLDTID